MLFDFRIFAPPWVDFRLIFVPPWVDFRFQLSMCVAACAASAPSAYANPAAAIKLSATLA